MVLLYKFLTLIAYPLGLSIVAGIAGVVFFLLKKKKTGLWLFGFSLGIELVLSIPFVGNLLLYQLESRYLPQMDYPRVSAIVLLGGCSIPVLPPRTYPEISDAGDRLFHAARLYKKGYAPYIIISGGKSVLLLKDHLQEADIIAGFLEEFFSIDSSCLILERDAINTYENGLFVDRIFKKNAWEKNILLVTSAFHMPRSVLIFKNLGFKVYAAPTDFNSTAAFFSGIYDFFPSVDGLKKSTLAIHEFYGIAGYTIMRWL